MRIKELAEKFKYPILLLFIAIMILLLPASTEDKSGLTETDSLLSLILSCTEGVGDARVIVSENGVVVVCTGANDAKVRLEILRAVGSYTGFASDRITVLKMAQLN